MSFYDNMKKTATRLLTKFGQQVTLSRHVAGAYDPSTGSAVVTVTDQSGIGAVFDYGSKDIDGMLILSGDKKLLLSATGITAPQVDDTVTIGAIIYTVKGIKVEAPAGTPVLFECTIRGS